MPASFMNPFQTNFSRKKTKNNFSTVGVSQASEEKKDLNFIWSLTLHSTCRAIRHATCF